MYISDRNGDLAALNVLKNAISLKVLGCHFDLGVTGAVCVRQDKRVIGAWWYENEAFHFASVARQKPQLSVGNIDDLVSATNTLAVSGPATSLRLSK
ncbi:MAG: hypothetical protein ACRBCJ_14785 [Hyphomicrobiaceae bacterium]